VAKTAAAEAGFAVHEGVYAAVLGPSFETPAEIRMLTDYIEKEESARHYSTTADKLPIAMPELVDLGEAMLGKESITVRDRLRGRRGAALGVFRARGDRGEIELKRDIFYEEPIESVEILRAEQSQAKAMLADKLREGTTLREGELLEDTFYTRTAQHPVEAGKVIVFAFPAHQPGAAKVAAHEIGHADSWLPDKTFSRGNILGKIVKEVGGVKKWLKTTVDALPTDPSRALAKEDRARLRKVAENTAKQELGSRQHDEFSALTKEIYDRLIQEEIIGRDLITRDGVMKELRHLTDIWNPFDPTLDAAYTKYRYHPEELYAEAMSVLLNNPKMLEREAPLFARSIYGYMQNHRPFREVYDSLMGKTSNIRELSKHRLDKVYRMFERGEKTKKALREAEDDTQERVLDVMMRGLVDKSHHALVQVRRGEKLGGVSKEKADAFRYEYEGVNFVATEVKTYLKDVYDKVLEPLQSWGATEKDLGAQLFLKRIMGDHADRESLANPGGFEKRSASATYRELVRKLGPGKTLAVETAAAEFRDIRERMIIPLVEESGLASPALLTAMKDTKDYATFNIIKHWEDQGISPDLRPKVYKSVSSAAFHRQKGTVAETENPFTATLEKDMSMFRAARLNMSKRNLRDLLMDADLQAQAGEELIRPADTKWNTQHKSHLPVAPKEGSGKGLLLIMEDGKPKGYYVSEHVARIFEKDPYRASALVDWFNKYPNAALRGALITYNPAWMARNVVRDFTQTGKNIPEIRLRDYPKLAYNYAAAWKETWRAVKYEEWSDDYRALMQNRAIQYDRAYNLRDRSEMTELEELFKGWAPNMSAAKEAQASNSAVQKALNTMNVKHFGQVMEQVGKVAGYKYLSKHSTRTPEEIYRIVRTRIGTPNYKRVGEWQGITNNLFLFSNVNKEGLRAMYESFRDDKFAYSNKVFWTNIAPKALLFMAGSGVLGASWKRKVDGISDYEKANYHVIPLGVDEIFGWAWYGFWGLE
jgi:hypothetical protein